MKKILVLLVVAALGAMVLTGRAASAPGEVGNTILSWKTMTAVKAPYLGAAPPDTFIPVDGVEGGRQDWAIARAWGRLSTTGELSVHTRGLILPGPPFNGTNPLPDFRALVKCRSTDASGNAVVVETFTTLYPASAGGDSDLETVITLPSPCIAPTVFVMHPAAPRWFATLGTD